MQDSELSVIIPCFNGGSYLSQAVESVLAQKSSVKSLEVVIINDHSCDPLTLKVLSHWNNRERRVRVLDNAGTPGPAAARNVGIASARGEWLAFLDADDIWLRDALQERWKITEEAPEAEWIGSDYHIWQENGSIDELGHFERGTLSRKILADAYRKNTVLRLKKPVTQFLRTGLTWTGTVMVKRQLVVKLGGFAASLRRLQDYHLWIRLARETDFFFVPKKLALYRQHSSSVSHEEAAPYLWEIAAFELLLIDPRFQPFKRLIRSKIASYHANNTNYYRTRKDTWQAIRSGSKGVRNDPFRASLWKSLAAAILMRR